MTPHTAYHVTIPPQRDLSLGNTSLRMDRPAARPLAEPDSPTLADEEEGDYTDLGDKHTCTCVCILCSLLSLLSLSPLS